MGLFHYKRKQKQSSGRYVRDMQYSYLLPRHGYEFNSDYFKYGNRYGTIMTMVVDAGGARDMDPFWRLLLVPRIRNLNDSDEGGLHGVHAELIEGYSNRTKNWTQKARKAAQWITSQEIGEGVSSEEEHGQKVRVRANDMQWISNDLLASDGYGDCFARVLISAWSLDDLDSAVLRFRQQISNNVTLGGVHFAHYEGQQAIDYADLLRSATDQIGNTSANMMATSAEYAGGYDLFTQGITDKNGDYIGRMLGDVNSTAILMDLDNYDSQVVIAHNAPATMVKVEPTAFDKGTRSSTLLGVRLAQSALINNHRVVHLVLNEAKPQNIGADLSDITTVVPLNHGAINPFEVFGSVKTELADFAAHKQKIRLMVQQIAEGYDQITTDLTSTDLNSTLGDILDDFYKDTEMMPDNPENNLADVKVINLPHDQYPKLDRFMVYLDTEYDNAIDDGDLELAQSINRVRAAFKLMNTDDADLFNVTTDQSIDRTTSSAQVVYRFSGLFKRSKGVAMAQFVNALQYATQTLNEGDVVIIHGTDQLTKIVKPYVNDVLTQLKRQGLRVVFLYDSLEACLRDYEFNHFRDSDYRMLGGFNQAMVDSYKDLTHESLPAAVGKNLVQLSGGDYGRLVYYLNRGSDNLIFALDMNLGVREHGWLSKNPKGIVESSADHQGDAGDDYWH